MLRRSFGVKEEWNKNRFASFKCDAGDTLEVRGVVTLNAPGEIADEISRARDVNIDCNFIRFFQSYSNLHVAMNTKLIGKGRISSIRGKNGATALRDDRIYAIRTAPASKDCPPPKWRFSSVTTTRKPRVANQRQSEGKEALSAG
jgi:hypothetical protein